MSCGAVGVGKWFLVGHATPGLHASLYQVLPCTSGGTRMENQTPHTQSLSDMPQRCVAAVVTTVSSTTASGQLKRYISHSPGEAPNVLLAAPPNTDEAGGATPPKPAPAKPPVLPKPGDGVCPTLNAMMDCAMTQWQRNFF